MAFLQVLIDFDDTLYNYTESDDYACQNVISYFQEHHHINDGMVVYKEVVASIKKSNNINNKHNKTIYFKKMLEIFQLPISTIDKVLSIYETSFYHKMRLFTGVAEFLHFLHRSKIRVGLVSNNQFLAQHKKLRHLEILECFHHITTTDEVGEEKPHPFVMREAISKFKSPEKVCVMIGDNFSSDVSPCFSMSILPFLFSPIDNRRGVCATTTDSGNHYYEFSDFMSLMEFFQQWIGATQDLRHLSMYFSQSHWCVQGSGGNISVKCGDSLVIKPSGIHMGDMREHQSCLLETGTGKAMSCPMRPSMESGFHCLLRQKYIVHLHFIPANVLLCSGQEDRLKGLSLRYKVIPYHHPGDPLCDAIQKTDLVGTEVLFLKNHGIIMLSETIDTLYIQIQTLMEYFRGFVSDPYNNVFSIYHKLGNRLRQKYLFHVEKHFLHELEIHKLYHISYFFPDMAVFFQHVSVVDGDDNLHNDDVGDLVIANGQDVFIVASSISKFYTMREILEAHCIISNNSKNLLSINPEKIMTDPKEIYRSSEMR